jgi:formimidoylglutamate deiminase
MTTLWAPLAWIDGRWQSDVLLRIGADGCFAELRTGVPCPPAATVLPGPVLPGMVDAHSHAFQRAYAGLAERRSTAQDDFWSWRERMYAVALRITPRQMRVVAAQLYAELLQGGYTQVCEFHYLHRNEAGGHYADPAEMALALVQAAQDVGIGLTLLPVLYERGGFSKPQLQPGQRRFASTVTEVLALRDRVRALGLPCVDAGTAVHSLRAARPESMRELVAAVQGDPAPLHLHAAEQTGEVEDCLGATGMRPLEWLCKHMPLDARWHMVHSTHAEPAEIEAVARTGAGVVVCPSTEANLGDGFFDLPRWLGAGVPLAIGSDSQIGRDWPAELRQLEYSQRLLRRERNVAADPAQGEDSTAARLLQCSLQGGAAAAGKRRWGLVEGARADMLVVDVAAGALTGMPATHLLDALVFSASMPVFSEVWVAGQRLVVAGRHRLHAALAEEFAAVMKDVWVQPEP